MCSGGCSARPLHRPLHTVMCSAQQSAASPGSPETETRLRFGRAGACRRGWSGCPPPPGDPGCAGGVTTPVVASFPPPDDPALPERSRPRQTLISTASGPTVVAFAAAGPHTHGTSIHEEDADDPTFAGGADAVELLEISLELRPGSRGANRPCGSHTDSLDATNQPDHRSEGGPAPDSAPELCSVGQHGNSRRPTPSVPEMVPHLLPTHLGELTGRSRHCRRARLTPATPADRARHPG